MSPRRQGSWAGRAPQATRAPGSARPRAGRVARLRGPRVRRCLPARPSAGDRPVGSRPVGSRPGRHLLARTARQQVTSGCPKVGFERLQVLGRSAVASLAPQGETEIPFRAGHPLPTRLHQSRSHPPAQSRIGRQPTDPVAQQEPSSLRSTGPSARAAPDQDRRGAGLRSASRSSPAGSCFLFRVLSPWSAGAGHGQGTGEVPRAVPVVGGSRCYIAAGNIFQSVVLTMKFAAWVT